MPDQLLNNIIEQDYRTIKRVMRPMLWFKAFRCARTFIAGIETPWFRPGFHFLKRHRIDWSVGA